MSQIDLDQELVDFLRANESLTGETPSELIRKLLQKRQPRRTVGQRARSENTDLAVFLRILREVRNQYSERFASVVNVRGRTRIYFSRNPKEIEASGRSTFPVEIPGIGWWVTSNTSTDHKRTILEDVFMAVNCSPEDRRRWLGEFSAADALPSEEDAAPEDDDPFKI
jgi:negative modulator of initiation of replication